MSATKEIQVRQAKWSVSLQQLVENLPSGVAKVVQETGHIPSEGTGKYSGVNTLRRLGQKGGQNGST